ncbi:glutathione S-transferase [Phenylobacterium sp.]|uniref:glutathione S-transferase family protein n=1 Tax=Phenylobacterium sp. TaxID=1871053 RepID=UPI00286ABCC5|nr:glutathione S-transferase [Phenylobacterium sp.]
MSKIRLYGTPLSGHAHRVELMLRILGLDFEFVEAAAAVRASPEYARLNPLRQIPVLEDGDLVLADSNAILVYLARRYDPDGPWLLNDPVGAAKMQRWLSIAAGEVMYGPATARMALQWNMPGDPVRAREIAERLLVFMEQHLRDATYLAADHPTIADLACYSYVAHAPEGAIPLAPYPAVRAWLARVEAQPWFKPLPASPIPA